ncbi:hypothetical protein K470DRAFT_212791 [Piedraia hortae CBS 480.64]|uniref:WSC domain-containing protein n=1 Tax=Piedraia hortae CBS 480.64 TaxID=1314780 RepID=A0A6A7C5W9_9PEZI|nr:hypothetical protein K470DRAFT_212791 [Piedraia hortae CBS 480.64]
MWLTWLLLASAVRIGAVQLAYCSSQNTGSSFTPAFSIYQSNGACISTCQAQYAYAILQWQNCWCSNYAPADQTDLGDCSQNCPGYPSDKCGNKEKGLYGYLKLNKAASGTGGASVSPSSSKASSSDTTTQLITSTSSPSSTLATTTASPTPSSSSSSSTNDPVILPLPATSEATSGLVTGSPVLQTRTIKISGAIVTQTVLFTPMVAPDRGDVHMKHGLSGGAIAGIVIGTLLLLTAVLLGIFLLWRRKQRKASEAAGPRRNGSVLSKTGLLARDMTENDVTSSHTSRNRQSTISGNSVYAEGIHPTRSFGSSHGTGDFRPMVYDQRLNPSALFAHVGGNGSRVSIQDQQDFSRPLAVRNPDIRTSIESRRSH